MSMFPLLSHENVLACFFMPEKFLYFCFSTVSTSKEHEQKLERDLDMAKRSAQAVINQLETELKEMKKKLSDQENQISGIKGHFCQHSEYSFLFVRIRCIK